jgi:hypothetical protein
MQRTRRDVYLTRPAAILICALCAPCALARAEPPDAVIELWEQHWTLNADGSTAYHEKKHVRLNSDRAYGRFADPRITFNRDTDEVEVVVARTKPPAGGYIDVPDYSRNEVSPGATAGWPTFAALRQIVLTMSALEPGCVVELEYRIRRRAEGRGFLAADVRVDDRHPVRNRVVSITAPRNRAVSVWMPDELTAVVKSTYRRSTDGASGVNTWEFGPQPAASNDPQAPDWRIEPGRRFAFSALGGAAEWQAATRARIAAAADESPLIARLAAEWSAEHADAPAKLRALQEKLAATFNFVDVEPDLRPAALRRASQVLESNYGHAEEAAAVLLALARAAGLPAGVALVVDDHVWLADAPQDGFIAACAIELEGAPPTRFDARHGPITRDLRWAGARVLSADAVVTELPAWTVAAESRIELTGRVKIDSDGKYGGTVTLRARGLFASGDGLRTRGEQERRLRELAQRALPSIRLSDVSVTALTPGTFEAQAKIESTEPLPRLDGAFVMHLPGGEPFEQQVALPLGTARRERSVRLAGAFEQQVSLTFTWPEGWALEAAPEGRPLLSLGAGSLGQQVTRNVAEPQITISRQVTLTRPRIAAADFAPLHAALSELRSPAQRTLVWRP